MSEPNLKSNTKTRLNIPLDFRWLSVALLVVIVAMLLVWKPWTSVNADNRSVSVTGTATLKAEPDQFVFYPGYEFKNADKTKALAEMSAKSDEVVAGLKKLGVADKDIKTNSNGYEKYDYPDGIVMQGDAQTYQLNMTVTVATREMSQKVQDYLLTTNPSGQVSPQGSFSDAKRKELEDKARDEANKDARAKAEKSAKSLGYRLGKVKSVEDGAGFGGGPITLEGRGGGISASDDAKMSMLRVQPGENDFNYSVTVVYFVK